MDDPKALDRLLASPPPGGEIPQVEFAYNTKVSGAGPVRCSHCKKTYENHFRGFVLVFGDGSRILVGKDCGRKHYGQDFNLVERRFTEARERSYYLRRREAALLASAALLAGLEQLGAHPGMATFRELRKTFNRGMPRLAGVLSHSIARRGAELTFEVQVRDIAAEERRDDDAERRAVREGRKWEPPKNPKPLFKMEERRFGVLAGLEFFRVETPPSDTVFATAAKLASAIAALNKTSRTIELRAFFKGLSVSLATIREQVHRVAALPTAMSGGNLALLASWAAQRDLKGYSHNGAALIYHEAGEPDARLSLPVNFEPPTDEAIVAFELALGGEVNAGFNRNI